MDIRTEVPQVSWKGMEMSELTKEQEFIKAMQCLYIATPAVVTVDISRIVNAYVDELRAALAEKEQQLQAFLEDYVPVAMYLELKQQLQEAQTSEAMWIEAHDYMNNKAVEAVEKLEAKERELGQAHRRELEWEVAGFFGFADWAKDKRGREIAQEIQRRNDESFVAYTEIMKQQRADLERDLETVKGVLNPASGCDCFTCTSTRERRRESDSRLGNH